MTSGSRSGTGAISWEMKKTPRSGRTQATGQSRCGSHRNGTRRAVATRWWTQFRAIRPSDKRSRTPRLTALILAAWTFGPPELFIKTFLSLYSPHLILPDLFILKTCSFVLTIYFGQPG